MADFDLVLRQGLIYDGTGESPRHADIAVRGDRIAAVVESSENIVGFQNIDCSDLCVAPGLIDVHGRSDLRAFGSDAAIDRALLQGVTLELIGQDGLGPAPLRSGDVFSRREQLQARGAPSTLQDVDWNWRTVADYFDALDEAHPALDLACLVPHGAVRESVLGLADRPVGSHDLARMKGLLARSLAEGGWGFSLGLSLPPGCFSDLEELVDMTGVAAARRVPMVARLRSDGEGLLDSASELLAIGRRSCARVHLARLSISGAAPERQLPDLLAILERARREGVGLTADVSPHAVHHFMLSSLLPSWMHEGGAQAALARLANPHARQRLREELSDRRSSWRQTAAPGTVLSSLPSQAGRPADRPYTGHPELLGQELSRAAHSAGKEPLDFALDLLRDEHMAVVMERRASEEVIEQLLELPWTTISAGEGAFARVLAKLVRERPVLSVEQAVHKMTGLPAEIFGLSDFGCVEAGKRASLMVFDPTKPEGGVPYVLVGGKLVVEGGALTGERPGRVVRRVQR